MNNPFIDVSEPAWSGYEPENLEKKDADVFNGKYVGEAGSPFFQYKNRTFIALKEGVHEMVDGVPVKVDPTPPIAQKPVEAIDGLQEAINSFSSAWTENFLSRAPWAKAILQAARAYQDLVEKTK